MNSKDKCSDSSSLIRIRLWLCGTEVLRLDSIPIQPLIVVIDAKPVSYRPISSLRKVRI